MQFKNVLDATAEIESKGRSTLFPKDAFPYTLLSVTVILQPLVMKYTIKEDTIMRGEIIEKKSNVEEFEPSSSGIITNQTMSVMTEIKIGFSQKGL